MNILILCTYPIANPKHGGQLRVRHIADAYMLAGHDVQVVGVLGSSSYEQETGFLPYPSQEQLTRAIANTFLMEDYALGQLFQQDEQCRRHLTSLIKTQPDMIHVEQPWLFGFAMKYAATLKNRPQLIYGSQNTEWRLKRDIVVTYQGPAVAEQCADLVKSVELQAVTQADAIVVVSQADANWLASNTDRPIILAPNGVKAWQSMPAGRQEARTISQGYRYALFCASAHPPNMTGFFELFGGGFGSLKPDEKLVVAGGASYAIAGDPRVHRSAKLAEKTTTAGMVSQACLEGLLDQASCIVLPITQGSGTNLKTAEALWSGKHIVATTVAMRGFERFMNAPGVHLGDEPASFKQALRRAMSAAPITLSQDDLSARQSVLWQNCLAPLISAINHIGAQTP
jgi:glycosyltransferase involved in cell wall biosynthesis